MPRLAAVLFVFFSAIFIAYGQPSTGGSIVVGFLGGMIGRDNNAHAETQLAARLRQDAPNGAYVRIFENRHGAEARREVLHLLDLNRDGSLSPAEKGGARIAIYGHSWGASEAVNLARSLGRDGIPVALTVQVDSIAKPGENDEAIPANVSQAINFYQRRGLLRGQAHIRAADGLRTQILGNIQLDYAANPLSLKGYPWYARVLVKPHIEIESDPRLWHEIESLIRTKVLAPGR